ncbi:cystatin domain-containing protein [Limnohabitans sp. Rim8]|uniref:cystatin family protein n=1 Tax=Limnohabitans sp. Rim8 TaxID=1100718 RepID=UPI0025F629AB|nr:cystatin domain-containing protein [Limnohabitans sp. Rim8]
MTGAWARADVFNPDVQEAARFAVQAFSVQNKARVMYKEVTQASQQVVAGLNFELQLLVTLDGVHRNVLVKVWRQLDGSYRLLSWVWQN